MPPSLGREFDISTCVLAKAMTILRDFQLTGMLRCSRPGTFAYGVLLAFKDESGSGPHYMGFLPKFLTSSKAQMDSCGVIDVTEQLHPHETRSRRVGFIDAQIWNRRSGSSTDRLVSFLFRKLCGGSRGRLNSLTAVRICAGELFQR